jgi:hypothetical protein
MSAKKRSFLCKIVHKLTENARFFAQKPHFLHIFAGGRDDFLAGPKTGFLGVRGVRERPRPRPVFCFEKTSPDGSDGRIATLQTMMNVNEED